MTRETKVGLIVAGSFLCLVCVVVASKLRHGDDPTNGATEESSVSQVAAVKPTQNTNAPEAKKKDESSKSAPPGMVVPANRKPTDGSLPPLVSFPAKETPSPHPMPATIEPGPTFPIGGGITLPPPDLTPSGLKVPSLTPQEHVVQAKDEKAKGASVPQPALTFPPPAVLQFPPLEEKKPIVADVLKPGDRVPVELPPSGFGKPDPLAELGKPPVKPDPALTFPPLAKDPPTRATVPFNEKDPPTPLKPLDTLPTFPVNPKDATPSVLTFPVNPKDSVPTFPKEPTSVISLNAKDNTVPVAPPLGLPTPFPKDVNAKAPSITLPVDPIKPGIALVPNDASMPSNPIPRIPGKDLPGGPPIMARPGFANDPASRPMPIIRDTDIHLCQPGDTNFAILSQKFYGTDKYAEALLKYNRDNAQATVNGTVFLSNTPTLVQGQQVHVAPVAILERDYRPLLRTASVAPVPTIPPAGPPLLSKPTPLSPGISTISNPPGAGQVRTYTVQSPNGESILDIAERVMGDRGQWHKIWRVNPSYQPQFRIPAGTKLEIPAS